MFVCLFFVVCLGFFKCRGGQTLEWFSQRGYGVSILGDIQAVNGPRQPAPDCPASALRLEQGILKRLIDHSGTFWLLKF